MEQIEKRIQQTPNETMTAKLVVRVQPNHTKNEVPQ